MGQGSDLKKSQLVTEICNISTRSIACRHGCSSLVQSSFIDWYRILQVKENAGADVIRKRYHELALQLHPDKNKHPKAEIAFKLVSEAYSCLSDSAKRRVFDLERWGKCCIQCGTIPFTTTSHHTSSNANASSGGHNAWNSTSRSKSNKLVKGLKDIRNRFREEARVIENCLRVNAAPRKESSLFSPPVYDVLQRNPTRESPVFNPSDHMVQGYPHLRSRVYDKPPPPQNFSNFWHLRTGHRIVNYEQGRTFDSPVFEVRSDRGIWKSRSTCVRS